MPPLAPDTVGGLRVLIALQRNGMAAFPARCLDEPVIRLRMPGRALVLASGREAVRHVLHSHAEDFQRLPAGRRILGPIVGRGLLVSEGETWRRQRRVMAPAFTPRTVPIMAGHILRCAEAACARLDALPDGPVDLLTEMQALSLDIAASSMFSLETRSFGGEMRAMVSRYMAGVGRPSPGDFLLPRGVPTPLALRRYWFRRRWKRLIGSVIAARRELGRAGAPRDLYDLMAAAHGEQHQDLLADEVATMIVAGHETTALALFWSCLLLAQDPAWQAAVAAEVSGADLSPGQGAAALPGLVVTRAVVQETLRLYPPASMTARLARRGQVVCGVEVPKGAMVLIPLFLLHRNPRWWTMPEAFDPARFLDGREPDRFGYLPFGAGPHVCIGAQLAMTEAVLGLARLIQQCAIGLATARPVLPVGVISTRPDHRPLFTLQRRSPA